MRNYKKYRSFLLTLFADFLADEKMEDIMFFELEEIERELSKGKSNSKYLWFRFFKDDNLVTNIRDFQNDLHDRNSSWVRKCMQIAIDNPKGFQIYYS